MLPNTVFAVRDDSGVGWHLYSEPISPGNIPEYLANTGLEGRKFRVIRESHVRAGFSYFVANDAALQAGWQKAFGSELWFPIEEPLPWLPGSPEETDIAIRLVEIRWGALVGEILTETARMPFYMNDLDDSLENLVRFIQVLRAGGMPHAALSDRARRHFFVQASGTPQKCRFLVSIAESDGPKVIDVVTDRDRLLQQLESFAAKVADEENLAHHFLCHGSLDTKLYDEVSDAADADWLALVASGAQADDPDAQDAFAAARIKRDVPLSDAEVAMVHAYRKMLRTLVIPESFSRSVG